LVNSFEQNCFEFSDYSMKYMGALVAECENVVAKYPAARQNTIARMARVCKKNDIELLDLRG